MSCREPILLFLSVPRDQFTMYTPIQGFGGVGRVQQLEQGDRRTDLGDKAGRREFCVCVCVRELFSGAAR